MENVKVIIWGLGAMGSGMADMLLKKKGVDIIGVAGRGAKLGKSMYDYIKTPRGDCPDVIIGTPEDVIKERVDVVCYAPIPLPECLSASIHPRKKDQLYHQRGRNGISAGSGTGACKAAG